MIARCPRCQVRYKVAAEKIGPRGSRLRCARCELVFRIEVPFDAAVPQQLAPAPDAPRALLVEMDETQAKRNAEFLLARGLRCEVVANGDVALLSMLRDPPHLALVGGYTSGLGPRDLIEAVRLVSELGEVQLVRIAAAEHALLPPGSESIPVLEPPDLPEGLVPVLEQLALGHSPQTAPAQAARPASPTRARRAPTAADPEVAGAERLARIVVADIILYNESKFDAAIAKGDVGELLKPEISEARALFESRVSAALLESRDFLGEEIQLQAERRRKRKGAGR